MMLQFTIVHMEYARKTGNMLQEIHDEDGQPLDLDNISLESVSVNRKSFLRIYEGVDLSQEEVRRLIMRGAEDPHTRTERDAALR